MTAKKTRKKIIDSLKRILSSRVLYILIILMVMITVLSNIIFQSEQNEREYMDLFIYIVLLLSIGLSNIYLLLRLYNSLCELNNTHNVIHLYSKFNVATILFIITFCLFYFVVLFCINCSIWLYVFDKKVEFVWQTKICAYSCVCFVTSLSISLFFLYIFYIIFLKMVLKISCEKCICLYPISKKIFYKIKKEISIANYIYWFTIAAYISFVFYHLYVYNGHNLTFQINSANFTTIWVYIFFIASFGYFIFFYFPNKLIYDNILKIKLRTIRAIEKRYGSNNEDYFTSIQFVYNSPSIFNSYFLNKLFPIITTLITLFISFYQLNIG